MELHEVASYLEKVGLQYMATVGLDGKPKVRPVQFMVEYGGRLWFCTNSKKSMYVRKSLHVPKIVQSALDIFKIENLEQRMFRVVFVKFVHNRTFFHNHFLDLKIFLKNRLQITT